MDILALSVLLLRYINNNNDDDDDDDDDDDNKLIFIVRHWYPLRDAHMSSTIY